MLFCCLNLTRMGGTPLASPRQMAQRTKAPKNLSSRANRPYIAVRSGLRDVAHVAIVQVHLPRVRRTVRVSSTRPVVVRPPHADKDVPIGPLARSRRA